MTPLEMFSSVVRPAAGLAPAESKIDSNNRQPAPPLSTRVSISSPGQALSKAGGAQGRYQDIEDSGLPDTVKHLLRMIRDLRQMLERLAQELQQVQADGAMSAETKRVRLLQLQAQMSAVNGTLIQATQKLTSLMRDTKLDRGQQMMAGHLALQ